MRQAVRRAYLAGITFLVICVVSLSLASDPALAACAAPVGGAGAYEQSADLVVLGTVENVTVFPESSRVDIRVEKVFKGQSGETLSVTTESGSQVMAEDDIQFERGTRYLLYLNRRGGKLTTSLCANTQPITGELPADLAASLGEGAVPGAGRTDTPAVPRSLPDSGGLSTPVVILFGLSLVGGGLLLQRRAR